MSEGNNNLGCQLARHGGTNQEACYRCSNNVHLSFKDIHIWHSKNHTEIEHKFEAQYPTSRLQMIFAIYDSDERNARRPSLLKQEFNDLYFIPAGTPNCLYQRPNDSLEVTSVYVETALFLDLLPKNTNIRNSLTEKIELGEATSLGPVNRPLTISMKGVIRQILHCMRKDDCRCLYFHAKVVELLSLQLEQLEMLINSTNSPLRGRFQTSHPLLKDEELERVYQVKELIDRSPDKKFSLLGLAHAVGTNDSTLKRHFKLVFGTTVFSYLYASRMEQARKQLLLGDLKISVVAQQYGYKHATHFSAAFKRYFGYPPTQIK